MNIVTEIQRFNADRDPARVQLKFAKMSTDPFVFFRGSCHLFYKHLALDGPLRNAPLAWSCGDLHLENFGSYKGDNRQAYFDLNDFDEAALAPATWDLVRVLTSLLVGAPSLGLSEAEAVALRDAFLAAYAQALQAGKAYWVEHRTAHGLIRRLLDSLSDRNRAAFLDTRTNLENGQRRFHLDGRKALPVTVAQRRLVTDAVKRFAKAQAHPAFFKVRDVAIRVAGTGSLGVDRYAVLVEGKGSPNANYILDIKEARPSSLLPRLKTKQPKWASEAHRVVGVQTMMQAVPMAFLHPIAMNGKPFVLRGLQPLEDRVELSGKKVRYADIESVAMQMAHMLAWAQLRSSGRLGAANADQLVEFGAGKKWQGKLAAASERYARQTQKDFAAFAQAHGAK